MYATRFRMGCSGHTLPKAKGPGSERHGDEVSYSGFLCIGPIWDSEIFLKICGERSHLLD